MHTVEEHISEVGAEKVAVVIVTFSEITPIAQSASQYDSLSQVLWFSTDTVVNDAELTNDPIAQRFFNETGLVITAYALSSNPVSDSINERAVAISGKIPNTYALSAYDVVWGFGLAILETGETDADSIKAVLPAVLGKLPRGLVKIQPNYSHEGRRYCLELRPVDSKIHIRT